ncbi:uncharacterized protein SAPINGB_P001046 [Magnusiomyces paraingens]|uniref:Uncharacterized protein n=1 Tax=Magnusiomyces paraingens TaxID=2606893 RepID=A0A5E8B9X3_9ASCO|nr:uncharacterized protein SAPINGB_P001046 [Saprochaete ingens]VVT46100.1 unnamed protein product [Saprochaete ingens]
MSQPFTPRPFSGNPTDDDAAAVYWAQQDAMSLVFQINDEFIPKLTLSSRTTKFSAKTYKSLLARAFNCHPKASFLNRLLGIPHTSTPEELWTYTKDTGCKSYCVEENCQPLYNLIFATVPGLRVDSAIWSQNISPLNWKF